MRLAQLPRAQKNTYIVENEAVGMPGSFTSFTFRLACVQFWRRCTTRGDCGTHHQHGCSCSSTARLGRGCPDDGLIGL